MEVVRSFVAVNLAPEVRKALDSIEVKLKERPFRFIKWVEPGNIHMTLKFLGDVPQDKISLIARAITDTVEPMAEFCLRLEALGAFPNWQRPQVIWVGVGGELDRLVAVQRELEEALFKLGFPRENRRFSPHLTLGRIRDQASANDRRQLADWAQSLHLETGLPIEVRRITLMKSKLTPGGPIYSELASASLKAKLEPLPD